jgi:hypothetical protein
MLVNRTVKPTAVALLFHLTKYIKKNCKTPKRKSTKHNFERNSYKPCKNHTPRPTQAACTLYVGWKGTGYFTVERKVRGVRVGGGNKIKKFWEDEVKLSQRVWDSGAGYEN